MGNRNLHGFNLQMEMVLTQYMPKLDLQAWAFEHAACASIATYASLDAAALNNLRRRIDAFAALCRLEPCDVGRHINHSTIIERVILRLRPKLSRAS